MCISTAAPGASRLNPGVRETVVSALRERGLRLTVQREAVCETVFNCPGHICAEHILGAVLGNYPHLRMNKTTVYRTLDLFLDLELVTEHKCADGRAQYEPSSRGHHSHMICQKCGVLMDIDPDLAAGIREGLRSRHGFRADLEAYPIFGNCPSCSP